MSNSTTLIVRVFFNSNRPERGAAGFTLTVPEKDLRYLDQNKIAESVGEAVEKARREYWKKNKIRVKPTRQDVQDYITHKIQSGGATYCPVCKSQNLEPLQYPVPAYKCLDCGFDWEEIMSPIGIDTGDEKITPRHT